MLLNPDADLESNYQATLAASSVKVALLICFRKFRLTLLYRATWPQRRGGGGPTIAEDGPSSATVQGHYIADRRIV